MDIRYNWKWLCLLGLMMLWPPFKSYSQGFPSIFDINDLDGTNACAIYGSQFAELLGTSIAIVGDINNDGLDDFALGLPDKDIDGIIDYGGVIVIFGSTSGFPSVSTTDSLVGLNSFFIRSTDAQTRLGEHISPVGDMNGDGVDDFVIGAPEASYNGNAAAGKAYVIFGRATGGFPDTLTVEDLDGVQGFFIGGTTGMRVGRSLGKVGDLNADGFSDLGIGDPGGFPDQTFGSNGAVHIILGKSTPFPSSFDINSIDSTNGFVIKGLEQNRLGNSISGNVDLNDDGISDLIIGSSRAEYFNARDVGNLSVIYGSNTGFPQLVDLENLTPSEGFIIHGFISPGYFGTSVSGLKDINGDNIDDLITSAPVGNSDNAGEGYIIYGTSQSFASPIQISDLTSSQNSKFIGRRREDRIGEITTHLGDINGDGLSDFAIGSSRAFTNFDITGVVFVIFGRHNNYSPTFSGGDLNGLNGFAIEGLSRGYEMGSSISSGGDLNGDGHNDFLVGSQNTTVGGSINFAGAAYIIFGRSSPTSISDYGLGMNISISPNPAHNHFNLSSPQAALESVAIYDLTGRALSAEVSLERHEAQVRCDYRGLLIVRVQTERGSWVGKVRME